MPHPLGKPCAAPLDGLALRRLCGAGAARGSSNASQQPHELFKQFLAALRREGADGSHINPFCKSDEANCESHDPKGNAPGGLTFPALFFFWGELFLALLHGYRELDSAELKIDLERVGVTRVQVGGDEIKLPVATNIVKGNVGNIVSSALVYVIHRAPHASQHGYRTATPVGKNGVRVGDRVAVGVAHRELHRDSPAVVGPEHTAAVVVDWRQNDASRVLPNACAIRNR